MGFSRAFLHEVRTGRIRCSTACGLAHRCDNPGGQRSQKIPKTYKSVQRLSSGSCNPGLHADLQSLDMAGLEDAASVLSAPICRLRTLTVKLWTPQLPRQLYASEVLVWIVFIVLALIIAKVLATVVLLHPACMILAGVFEHRFAITKMVHLPSVLRFSHCTDCSFSVDISSLLPSMKPLTCDVLRWFT